MIRKSLACTIIVNTLLVVVGATTLVLAAEDQREQEEIERSERFLLFPSRRRFDWQRTIQSGIKIGMGLILSIVGVVRQVDVERHARNSSDVTPLVLFSGWLMCTFVVLSNSERDSRNNHKRYEDEVEDSDEHDCDDNVYGDENWNLYILVRPAEDGSVGADPVEHSINRGNDRSIIRNSVMFTIQNVVNSFHARDDTISVSELTTNEVVNGENDFGDDAYQDNTFTRIPEEQESIIWFRIWKTTTQHSDFEWQRLGE